MIKIAILGYGTVGSGVYEVLTRNRDIVAKNVGEEVEVKYVLDLREFPGDPVEKVLVHDYEVIANDPEVAVVVEVMGGTKPAYEFVKRALMAGKAACTSNKALVAAHGPELLAIASEHNSNFLFEASCGGGIPIIRPLHTCITADEIDGVSGILNGTTNYILTRMKDAGIEFADALKEAQDLGYAERDPSADVNGWDTCRKISILSSIAYGKHVDFEQVYTEGISDITSTDLFYAKEWGAAVKLLGTSKKLGDTCYVMVSPVMIGRDNPLYPVDDVYNGIIVHGNMLGTSMFFGSGAGKLPTASAVAADVVEAARNLTTCVQADWSSEPLPMMGIEEIQHRFFVRLAGTMYEELPAVEKVFGKVDAKILPGRTDEFAFITGVMTEASFREKASIFKGIISRIRVDM